MCSHSPVNGLLLQPSPFALDSSLPLDSLHPPPAMIPFMWQTYLETVDPVLKIFHAPTVQKQIMSRIRGRRVHDPSAQCLMFAIYYSTVVTTSAAACLAEFEEERPALLKRYVSLPFAVWLTKPSNFTDRPRYRTGIENALWQANVFQSSNVTVLQAFVIYLVCEHLPTPVSQG